MLILWFWMAILYATFAQRPGSVNRLTVVLEADPQSNWNGFRSNRRASSLRAERSNPGVTARGEGMTAFRTPRKRRQGYWPPKLRGSTRGSGSWRGPAGYDLRGRGDPGDRRAAAVKTLNRHPSDYDPLPYVSEGRIAGVGRTGRGGGFPAQRRKPGLRPKHERRPANHRRWEAILRAACPACWSSALARGVTPCSTLKAASR
jgi:hypothetical protein